MTVRQTLPALFPQEDVKRRLVNACQRLLTRDSALLQKDVNERSISHRLALYLQGELPKLDVDCEYNRDEGVPKRIFQLRDNDIQGNGEPFIQDTKARTVFPDIIVHHRGKSGTPNNLLIIEIKKTTSNVSDSFDHKKLNSYKTNGHLGYQHAVFIKLCTGQDKPDVERIEFV
jgi:hypothetical protein